MRAKYHVKWLEWEDHSTTTPPTCLKAFTAFGVYTLRQYGTGWTVSLRRLGAEPEEISATSTLENAKEIGQHAFHRRMLEGLEAVA